MNLSLDVNGLCLVKGYNRLISNLNFAFSPGEAISLSGANGAGKTTLLRTLAGFQVPDSGTLTFCLDGVVIESEVAQAQHIHLLGHHDALSPTRTVEQELRFQADFLGGDGRAAPESAVAPLRLQTLLDLETRYLSAGQKRRLSCARLLMCPRALWLLDEPMAPLDADHRELLGALMQAHLAQGGSIIAAVHDPLPFATRSLRLERPSVTRREAERV